MQLSIARLPLALTGLGLLPLTHALPSTPKAQTSSGSSSLYIHPSFVPTNDNHDDPHGLRERSQEPSLFTSTFSKQDQQTFLCQVDQIVPTLQRTLVSDCEQLQRNLLGMPGFWECRGWEPGQYHTLVGYGSCQFQVSRSDGTEFAVIGNGDVYATLMLALSQASDNGTVDSIGFYGKNVCGPSPVHAQIDFVI